MADSPTFDTDGPVGVSIKINGSAISDVLLVASVKVYKQLGRIPEAVVTIETGSIPANEFDVVDGAEFDLGAKIEVSAFYGDEAEGLLFKGIIYGKRLRIRAADPPQMILTCRDKAAVMNVVSKTTPFADQKDSDVMSNIIKQSGLTADIKATQIAARDQLQHNCTDWDFLRMLADRNGYILLSDDEKIKAAPPDVNGAAVLSLTLGVDIITFDAEADTRALIGEASGRSWDEAGQDIVEEDAKAPKDLKWGNLKNDALSDVIGGAKRGFAIPDVMDAADMGVIASARRLRSSLSALQGRCSFQGNAKPLPDTMIEIAGVGERFGGTAYISGVEQQIERGEWTTEVMLGLPADWRSDVSDLGGADAAGLTTPIRGLQIATVVTLMQDPDDRLRVQVKLPMLGIEETLVWARFAAPYATADAGIQFMPEIGDEVVVAFLNADPNAPVILGSLHNGTAAQPYTPDEPNTFKGIVSKSRMKIEFEDEKKILTLETPGGHKVVMDDDTNTVTITDSNGNEMEMAAAGIALDSPGDITLTAKGKIALEAVQDVTVEGLNVELSANAQITASGNASAELSSSGQTVVKGSIVMIN
ncbi:hypothetical protein ROLI_001580 [Roseobacter fucihabitans]|uniref:Gp5/Type VI secretion system Vgr protein OB-fold domain-containing protein n=1 Tax=Roseobacter fucihabitans TaxID=1537242 RepID=A0ABZ2BNE3_9RHOB|nr:type VI secretion system tip protein VgrG [Roseobacter litoralis]MBC6963408.1 Phage-related baseplate assembly protein [Roseobacter litoralis]